MGCGSVRPFTGADAEDEEALPPVPREFRAAWIATVANIDWPSEPGLPVEAQKAELRAMLDQAAALNFNAIIFQVRPHADALYDSEYEPWSYYLTGAQGRPPEPFYDPLAFAVDEAHERGLELHAWFNPFRAGHPADTSALAPNHIRRTHSELVVEFGDYLWLDPGMPETRAHSHRVIMDVVERYDVDGIHFDDYFYPYPSYDGGADFPDTTSWRRAQQADPALDRDDWRRENVNRLIEGLYRDIKATKPHVKFGISPFGIWRPGYPVRTTGFDAHDALYADARTWLEEGWVDYFTPQLYYGMDQTGQPYSVMLRWWIAQNAHDRHIWPGNYTSRVRQSGARGWSDRELIGQIYATRAQPGASGNVHFSMKALMPVPDRLLHPAPDTAFAADSRAADSLQTDGPVADTVRVDSLVTDRLVAGSLRIDSIYAPEPPAHLQTAQRFVDRLAAEPYAYPALVPASPWLDDEAPGRPTVSLREDDEHWTITMQPAGDELVRWWIIRRRDGSDWSVDVVPGTERTYGLGHETATRPDAVVVSAVDRVGNKGAPATVGVQQAAAGKTAEALKPDIVPHGAWHTDPPRGEAADAVRRNLPVGEALQFKNLTVRLVDMRPEQAVDSVAVGVARVVLQRGEVRAERTVRDGQAFNWHGYHIGVLALNTDPDAVGGGLAEFEVATVASLSPERAMARRTGGAAARLRVPHTIHRITLHHSGSAEPLTPNEDPTERLRGLQQWGGEARNWWDVPYHYLIDLDGTIYEGRDARYAGETNTPYDPRGHLLISVIGNYNEQEPTPAQIEGIADLMAWVASMYDVPLDRIGGHSDWADTSCPGIHLQPYLDDATFVRAVEARLGGATERGQ